MGLASVNLTQLAQKAAALCEIIRSNGHRAVPEHSASPILVPIESPYENKGVIIIIIIIIIIISSYQ